MTLNKSNVLEWSANGLSVFTNYLGEVKPGKRFLSPLRKESNPSANIYKNKNNALWYYHDFATGEHYNAIDFVMQYFELDFMEALRKINYDLGLELQERRWAHG